jgi:hypothetical protein
MSQTQVLVVDPVVEAAADQIFVGVKGGLSPEDAARKVALLVGTDNARAGLKLYRDRAREIGLLRDPEAVVNPDGYVEPWYPGPTKDDVFWPAYRDYLLNKKMRSRQEVDELDKASTRILSLLPAPGTLTFSSRGLVVGSVQSGKTGNFTAVITKAADVNYRFFLVLSGMTDQLRNQTQGRIDTDALQHTRERWITITNIDEDFAQRTNVDSFLSARSGVRTIGVIKKNGPRLRRLLTWLRGARPEVLRNCSILIIDDEADQATPNAHRDPNRRSEINRLVVELLGLLPKAAYVGYTATPYANLLGDTAEEGIYPRDFIVDLPASAAYFGPERIFGREQMDWDDPDELADGVDMIRIVPLTEVPQLRPSGAKTRWSFIPTITASLSEALRYFVMATAARRARGQSGQHSSMLIHSSQFTNVHESFVDPISKHFDALSAALVAGDPDVEAELRAIWEREQAAVPASLFDLQPVPFEAVRAELAGVLVDVEVKVENAQSTERIDYETPGRTYVVIGGNILARGLTIEGLTVSHFVRSASAYDALLQMGRWFGYRPGYEDLPRMWMTNDLRDAFYHLAGVEEDIRHQIGFYVHQHLTPLTLGIKIRTHPKLAITSKLKMWSAVRSQMSFSNKTPQTILFHHRDQAWLDRNLDAARKLVRRISDAGIEEGEGRLPKYRVFRGVMVAEILQFIEEYQFHPEQIELQGPLVRGYIEDQNRRGNLLKWNVVVVGRPKADLGTVNLGLSQEVPLVNRSRFLRGSDPTTADIKALISEADLVADLPPESVHMKELSSWRDLKAKRQQVYQGAEPGLLLLYPISQRSVPEGPNSENKRLPLQAVQDVIGIGFVFPDAAEDTPREYVTAALPDADIDELEFEEEADA